MPDALFPHQQSAVEQLLEGKRGLFHPYGLGKSWTILKTLLGGLLPRNGSFVVLCKKRNILTWTRELQKRIAPDVLIYAIGDGSDIVDVYERALAYHIKHGSTQQIFLISYSVLASKLPIHILYLSQMHFEAIIADESTKLKNYKAQVTKAALILAGRFSHTVRIIMTGNPKPEGPHELWSQLQFTGMNPFEDTYYRFLNHWFVKPSFGAPILMNGKENAFKRKLENFGVWIHPTDLAKLRSSLGLPLDQYVTENFELSRAQRNTLQQLYSTWALPDAQDATFEMNYTMSLSVKAQQICSGFYLDDKGSPVYLFKDTRDNPKMEALRALLSDLFTENPMRKVIIWRKFTIEDALIHEGIEDMFLVPPLIGPDDESIMEFYNNPEAKVIIMPVDIGDGFNELVKADVGIYFSNDYSQEKRNQSEARISRLGQQEAVVLHIDLASEDGRDSAVIEALQTKSLTPARLHTIIHKYFNQSMETI